MLDGVERRVGETKPLLPLLLLVEPRAGREHDVHEVRVGDVDLAGVDPDDRPCLVLVHSASDEY